MDRLCDKLGFARTFFLNRPAQDEDSPLFWRSNASATKMARERCYPRLRWLKEIATYQKQFLEFPKLDLPRFHIPDDFKSLTFSQIDHLAQECREWWNFGAGPIPDLLLEMENSGIITARINVAADSLMFLAVVIDLCSTICTFWEKTRLARLDRDLMRRMSSFICCFIGRLTAAASRILRTGSC